MSEVLDPEVALAIAYARAQARAGLRALWELDARLAGIVRTTSEPMIGAMRLAWWREAIAGERPAAGEPLLERVIALPLDRAALSRIAEGWGALLQEPIDVAAHGEARGAALFEAAAAVLGGGDAPVAEAGQGWALVDLGYHLSDPDAARQALEAARAPLAVATAALWPPALRPLGMLAHLARRDVAGGERRQGSPARQFRMLRHRLTGR